MDGITDLMDEFERTPEDGEGQGSLVCCSPWGHKELDTTTTSPCRASPFPPRGLGRFPALNLRLEITVVTWSELVLPLGTVPLQRLVSVPCLDTLTFIRWKTKPLTRRTLWHNIFLLTAFNSCLLLYG